MGGGIYQELFDVLDAAGHKTGKIKSRTAVHRDGDWHRAVNIFVVNPQYGLLLQRRCPTKDSYPNYLDISCGGHLVAGDNSITGAIRELKEELGIDVEPQELQYITTQRSSDQISDNFINNSFNDAYLLMTNKALEDFQYQASEISEIFFVPLDTFQHMVETEDPELVPHPHLYPAFLRLFPASSDGYVRPHD